MSQAGPQQGEPRNPLLDAIMSVVNDGQNASIIRPVLERANKELANLRVEVSETVEGLQPRIREACTAQIQQVNQAFTLYEGGLTTISSHFADGQTYTLVRGGEIVRRASFQLNDGLFNLRNQALVAMGPTDIPDYNFIHQLYEKVKSGEIERDGNFFHAVDRARRLAQVAMGQVARQPASPERELVRNAYQQNVGACDLLLQFVKEGRPELLEKGIEDFRQSLVAIRDLIPQMQMRLRTAGPTSSPMANFVLSLAVELASGAIPDQVLRDALGQLKANFEDLKRQFEGMARGHIDSVLVQEEAERMREALALEEEAIDTFYRFFEIREGLLLGQASNALIEAIKQLDTAQKAFMEIADREGKTLCVRCSHYNERDRRTCEKCGAKLLQPAETGVMSTLEFSEQLSEAQGASDEIPVGENIERIFMAVNQVAENEISLEQFASELAWMEGVVEHYAASVGTRPLTKTDSVAVDQREHYEHISALNQEADAKFEQAVAYFREGLSRYRTFLEDQDKNHLLEGTRSVWEANKRLHEVQTMTASLRESGSPQDAG